VSARGLAALTGRRSDHPECSEDDSPLSQSFGESSQDHQTGVVAIEKAKLRVFDHYSCPPFLRAGLMPSTQSCLIAPRHEGAAPECLVLRDGSRLDYVAVIGAGCGEGGPFFCWQHVPHRRPAASPRLSPYRVGRHVGTEVSIL
jgi:hypothetical protein